MDLEITYHAVKRYLQRSGQSVSYDRAKAIVLDMASNPDFLKVVSGGQILHYGDWILIQVAKKIVTVYKGDEETTLKKRIWKPANETRPCSRNTHSVEGFIVHHRGYHSSGCNGWKAKGRKSKARNRRPR